MGVVVVITFVYMQKNLALANNGIYYISLEMLELQCGKDLSQHT